MARKMHNIDRLVMLLSTDWFLRHWPSIGIAASDREAKVLQEGFRGLVKQIISGAEQYWLASFTEERLQKTSIGLDRLLRDANVQTPAALRIRQLAGDRSRAWFDHKAAWLTLEITRMLLEGAPPDETAELAPNLREILMNSYACSAGAQVDFEKEGLQSNSPWDRYMRALTPDLPTFLSDYVSVVILKDDEIGVFWASVCASSEHPERVEILGWYNRQASALTGEEISLPECLAE